MQFTHDDIQAILRLLDDSPYDELNLQTERFSLSLKRQPGTSDWQQEQQTLSLERSSTTVASLNPQAAVDEPAASEAGLLDIRAPMVGTFYRAPKPGAAPFVEVGAAVEDNAVIAIIEVMKLMSSIPAGVSGTVVEILAEDAQPVSKGQLLMRVRPAS